MAGGFVSTSAVMRTVYFQVASTPSIGKVHIARIAIPTIRFAVMCPSFYTSHRRAVRAAAGLPNNVPQYIEKLPRNDPFTLTVWVHPVESIGVGIEPGEQIHANHRRTGQVIRFGDEIQRTIEALHEGIGSVGRWRWLCEQDNHVWIHR